MKIMLGYSYYPHVLDTRLWIEGWLERLRPHGMQIDAFYLTMNPPGPCLTWPELDAKWKARDPELMKKYEILAKRINDGGYDVFLNYNGVNVHPEFLAQLKTFNVFACFDDPENSHNLSKPAAAAYDLALCGNIAELDTYRSWGVREVYHWPHGFRFGDYDPELTKEKILSEERPYDILFACDRGAPWRQAKINEWLAAFPDGGKNVYIGRGWARGHQPESHRVLWHQRAKIGPNIHHSTGPINYRTFFVPANGMLLIGDNKRHLGQLFELNKEVVGFDTIAEGVDLCRYYLAHEQERRQIAAAGWERALKDYNEVAVMKRILARIAEVKERVGKRSKA